MKISISWVRGRMKEDSWLLTVETDGWGMSRCKGESEKRGLTGAVCRVGK